MIEQGETVVVLGTRSARAKKTGKTANNEWVHVSKFRPGKTYSFRNTSTPPPMLPRCRSVSLKMAPRR